MEVVELRRKKPTWNKGLKGYTNKGSFKVGHSLGKGKKHSAARIRRFKASMATDEQRRKWIKDHHSAVLKIAKFLKSQGKEVWTCLDEIPDLIEKRGKKLIAYEVTASNESSLRMKKRRKHKTGFFNEVVWMGLKGELR